MTRCQLQQLSPSLIPNNKSKILNPKFVIPFNSVPNIFVIILNPKTLSQKLIPKCLIPIYLIPKISPIYLISNNKIKPSLLIFVNCYFLSNVVIKMIIFVSLIQKRYPLLLSPDPGEDKSVISTNSWKARDSL